MSRAESLRPTSKASDPQKAQSQASNPLSSVWVNASAGSGKTTVLTGRVMRLLLNGVKPERILCITFTRAGAAEMVNRVTERLSYWATCSDNALSADIGALQNAAAKPAQMALARKLFARTLSAPGGMRIRTIHAFCQEILRRFPVEAKLPPHFAVIEEDNARALQDEALKDILHFIAEAPDTLLGKALRFLTTELGEKGFDTAMRRVLNDRARMAVEVAKVGGLDKLIDQMRTYLALKPNDTDETLRCAAVDFSTLPHIDIRQAATWLLEGSPSYVEQGENLLAWLDLPFAMRVEHFELYSRCFLKLDGEPFQKFGNQNVLKAHPELDTIMRQEAARLRAIRERLDAQQTALLTAAVLTVGMELADRYQARKSLQAALDYDDLIIRTDNLLRRPSIAPWVLYKLDGGLDHILVDEAQDTSLAQWRIVAALADEFFAGYGAKDKINRTLFVVGDEKQSIFSFQRADPEAFASMRVVFEERITGAKKSFEKLPLHVSFRSAPAVLEAIDSVFATPAARAGVAEEPTEHLPAPLRKGEAPKLGRVEVWPLRPSPAKEEGGDGRWQLPLDYEEEQDPQAELAAQIADKIGTWLTHKEVLPGFDRPIVPGDIMILLRRRRRFADLMVRALKKRNVPVTGVDRMHLIQQLPVMDLLALIQFTLLPEDDLNLATVLRGPLLNLSEDHLMLLAIGRKGTLWQSLREQAHSAFREEERNLFSDAETYLARLLGSADFTTPFAMLARVLNEACPGSPISGRCALWSRLGPDALDPIEELLNAAQSFTRSHTPSLQSFLHWLTASDHEIKRELDHDGSQVRIMTVHAAKGLEAPIVFLPDTASVPRPQDVPELLWSDTGIPLYVPRMPSVRAARQLWDEARQKQMEEYRRLLYVALTRAANRLYIGGWETGRKEGDNPNSWYRLITEALKPNHQRANLEGEAPEPSIVIADPEWKRIREKSNSMDIRKRAELPNWAKTLAPIEPLWTKPILPSRITAPPATATPDSAYARGRIIHRLLQSLPDIEVTKREKAASRFLTNPQHHLTKAQQDEIRQEVITLLSHPDYAPLFGPESRAEVAIAGQAGETRIAGQVDRLSLHGDDVWIVDYKTNRPPPERVQDVAQAYRAQLASYQAVLQKYLPPKTGSVLSFCGLTDPV